MSPVPCGTISALVSSLGPSRTSFVGSAVWLEIVIVASPAPTFFGELWLTINSWSEILALSAIGAAGLGSFLKSSEPQALNASAATDAASGAILLVRAPIVGATLAQHAAARRCFGCSERQRHDLGGVVASDLDRGPGRPPAAAD